MKLVNLLGVTVLGAMFVVGCSSSDVTTTDGGKADSTPTDTGTGETTTEAATDTPAETPAVDCPKCVTANCSSQFDACQADTECKGGVDAANACVTGGKKPSDCWNEQISKIYDKNAKFAALVDCLNAKCKADCLQP